MIGCSAKPIPVGAKVIDSLPFSMGGTAEGAQAIANEGVDAIALYIGAANVDRVQACLSARRMRGGVDRGSLGVFAVTFGSHAARLDGPGAVATAKAWGLPAGTSIFLDFEGPGLMPVPPGTLIAEINSWADAVASAGYVPGIYVAPPQPLTSDELYQLRVVRYWKGGGSIRDRNGQLAEPSGCGWCMTQMWPSQMCGGYLVDFDMVGDDFRSRAPSAAYAL